MLEKSLFFTKDVLQKIESPKEKRDIYKDIKEAGLILIVSYGGSKTFYLGKKIQGMYHRIKIGRFPDLSIVNARMKASELKSQIVKGINPLEEKTKLSNELTFKELFDKYINDYAKYNNNTWQDCIDEVNRHAKCFYSRKISTISKTDIQQWFTETTKIGKHAANKALARIKAIFNKAIEWELVNLNPAVGIKKHKEESRDRYLMREELSGFFQGLKEEKNQIMQDFFLIALFTGVRKNNVLTMRWEHISFADQKWYIPKTKSKNKESYTVILANVAMKILEKRKRESNSEWVFPSEGSSTGHLREPKKAWGRICQKAELKDLRIHDLRRTHASWMAISGASQYVIGKALNHKDSRSTEIYAKLNFDPVREFVEKAINEIITIAEKKN
ncbi:MULTISPECIES: tyrosine-type recombinase/integrase [Rickettsieae]|uniref:tyrosine-type recombinase/integrase n=1 Tax=Rickettsieae TaxID=33988 RepID=UPI00202557A5|nr:site-specific integrase [Rickettsia endosymbiont of Oedothorax gibbosus]